MRPWSSLSDDEDDEDEEYGENEDEAENIWML